MQIKCLHKNVYKLYSYARTQECLDKHREKILKPVKIWEKLKRENVSDQTCHEMSGISRAQYYRNRKTLKNLERGIMPPSKRPHKVNKPRWGESEKQWVLKIRRENPTYGKAKIAVILKRDHGGCMSESTVGRILKYLSQKGLAPTSCSAPRVKRKRHFAKRHAQPWTFKNYAHMVIGERIQVDHMTVTKNGLSFKHFQAWDRKSKYIHANVYSNAKSSSAKKFLLELIQKCPFKIRSIQVDGGSEFQAEFEAACQELGLPLMVLPPRKPKYNGGVERGNKTFREEFYNSSRFTSDSIGSVRYDLKQALSKYNSYRPHFALHGLTPLGYIHSHVLEVA